MVSGKDWKLFMGFSDRLIEALPIGEGRMRVGIVEFANTAVLVQPLSDDKAEVLRARRTAMGIPSVSTRTYMSNATKVAREQLADKSAPRVLVLITDGLPEERERAAEQFEAAKADGIKVIMVTVGELLPPPWAVTRVRACVCTCICTYFNYVGQNLCRPEHM